MFQMYFDELKIYFNSNFLVICFSSHNLQHVSVALSKAWWWSKVSDIICCHGPFTRYVKWRMRRECRERFPRHRLQRKPLVSYPGMHHGTCVTHVPWCMSGSLNHGGAENVPGIPGAYATLNFTYLVRGPLSHSQLNRRLRYCNQAFYKCKHYNSIYSNYIIISTKCATRLKFHR